jgi:hypothetical protein
VSLFGAVADHYVAAGGGGGTAYRDAVLADSPLAYYRLGDVASGSLQTASSSSNFSGEPPANAFDTDPATVWDTNGTSSGWLQAQLTLATVLTGYKITQRSGFANRMPKDWTFKGSNNGTTWTTLDTRSAQTWPTSGEVRSFTFTNSTAYLYYRLDVSANNGDTYLTVGRLDLGLAPMVDSSGNGRDGTYAGSPTLGVTGLVTGDTDTAVTFNGTTQQAQVLYGSWMNTSSLTLEAISNPSSVAAGAHTILDRDNYNDTRTFTFRLNGNKLEFTFWLTLGGPFTVTGATSLSAGTKYHVAVKFDAAASLVTLYVNGASDGTYSVAGGSSMQTSGIAPLTVAANYEPAAGGGPYFARFAGTIDEAAYYGAALSATRIAAHAALI